MKHAYHGQDFVLRSMSVWFTFTTFYKILTGGVRAGSTKFYNAWRQKAELFKKSSVIDHTEALKLQDSLFQRRGKIVD
jgi:hypothetical protein